MDDLYGLGRARLVGEDEFGAEETRERTVSASSACLVWTKPIACIMTVHRDELRGTLGLTDVAICT